MNIRLARGKEALHVWAAVAIALVLAFYRLLPHIENWLGPWAESAAQVPYLEWILNALFVWLLVLLWLVHGCWRETERRQAELQAVFASISPVVILVVGRDDKITMCNDAVREMFGYDVGEVIHRMPGLLYSGEREDHTHPDTAHALGDVGFRIRRAEGKRKNGETFVVEIIAGSLKGYEGTVMLLRDVSEQERTAEALQQANRDLEAAIDELKHAQEKVVRQERLTALGEMASGIVHDLNNLLSPILGYTDLLLAVPRMQENRETVDEHLRSIKTASTDAANVVRRLRQFYRQRDDSEPTQFVDLNKVIRDALLLTQPEWKNQALAKGVSIKPDTDLEELPLVPGSESELRVALVNLILNAVDALAGDGTIRCVSRHDAGHVRVEVRDTGTGMKEHVQRRCLEPFFTTRLGVGTGLGLPVVYGILQRHGGDLQIRTAPGTGTTVTLRLPVPPEPRPAAERAPADRLPRRLTILLVEDEAAVCDLLLDYLSADGHTVEVARNGRDAISKFHAGWYDLVITSVAMPEMSGLELAAVVKQVAPRKPVLVVTGLGDIRQFAGETPANVELVIGKPVSRDALQEAMTKVMNAA